jgi:hypothetical protein
MPRRAWQVSTERIFTLSMPEFSMSLTFASSISSLAVTSTSPRERIVDVLERDAAEDALAERLDDLAALDERADSDAVHGAAVVLGDDRVLGDVDQPPGQVPGVGGLERRVRQALAGAVRRDEVLQDVRPSRKFAVIGVSMISPEGLAMRPRMPASWRICCGEPRAPESAMM